MSGEGVPTEVGAYVVRTFHAIAQLEALLLLVGEPSAGWTAERVAGRLYVTVDEARRVLDHLQAVGLAAPADDGVRYAPASADDDRLVALVKRYYASHLIPITTLIHARPASRIQEFADAFKLKRKED